MNVSLTPELESLVASKVESGRYTSASEVVREGIRLLQQRDEIYETKLAAMKSEIRKGLDDIEADRVYDGKEVFDEMTAMLDRKRKRNG